MSVVVAEGLKKRFGDTEALRGVDFEVPRGTVLGLLGPNGAGKTTAVRILTTLLRPDSGRAVVDGVDVLADPRGVRARIGVTGQYAAVDERLTGRENLEHVGRLFHMRPPAVRERAGELLDRFDLADAAERVVKGYSGGMRRRLDIAMSLISQPSVLFLDEPTTGLDPRSRLGMWELIDELVRDGTTTVLTTQYLDEAERLADNIVVIDHGEVIARGTADELKGDIGGDRVEVTAERPEDLDGAVDLRATFARPAGSGGAGPAGVRIDREALTVTMPVPETEGIVPAVVRLFDSKGVPLTDVVVRRPTLDDVFLQLTGHTADEEPAGDNPERGAA
jgi:ABC-2 type transport system ATP-binding protein